MWYGEGIEGTDSRVGIVTHPDFTAPATCIWLPSTFILQNSQVMVLRKTPRVVDWGPKGDHADLVMFKVPTSLFFLTSFMSTLWSNI